jgi:hypothetical protein
MSATGWRALFLFVEGQEDELFIERIIVPCLESRYDYVRIHQYAQRRVDQLVKHFDSLVEMGAHFFLFADFDRGPCIQAVKQAVVQRYQPHLRLEQVLIVRPMIEAWYYAGVPNLDISHPVETIDKQTFAKLFGRRAEQGLERKLLLSDILKNYDWELALSRCASLNYCARKLGLI